MSHPSSTLYPGAGLFPGMADAGPSSSNPIKWDQLGDRRIETGLDRGVLYPKSGHAVPWVGLTSVDEEGGESVVEYFIDGRPYLYLPVPKEFKATIKAFTYPDAFSAFTGEIEATDGMYLDSQMSDSFDLSYRTKIADAVVGVDAAYKIHLIYNATVVPSAKSYTTIGDSVSPVEFSWDIQAVPVAIEGYRATAHITIDTRHMDAAKLAEIENMLYGDVATAAMPDPQSIFDTLTFGDTIVIVDNGDGTWDAIGSYRNVYLTGDGMFQIDNVIATNNLDGTYDISTTPAG